MSTPRKYGFALGFGAFGIMNVVAILLLIVLHKLFVVDGIFDFIIIAASVILALLLMRTKNIKTERRTLTIWKIIGTCVGLVTSCVLSIGLLLSLMRPFDAKEIPPMGSEQLTEHAVWGTIFIAMSICALIIYIRSRIGLKKGINGISTR